jgi:hypothetical protein
MSVGIAQAVVCMVSFPEIGRFPSQCLVQGLKFVYINERGAHGLEQSWPGDCPVIIHDEECDDISTS